MLRFIFLVEKFEMNNYTISNINDFKNIIKWFWTKSYIDFSKKIKWSIITFNNSLLYVDKDTNEYKSHFKEPYLSLTLADNDVKKIIKWDEDIIFNLVNKAKLQVFRNIEFKSKWKVFIDIDTEFSNCIFNELNVSSLNVGKKITFDWWSANEIYLDKYIQWEIYIKFNKINKLNIELNKNPGIVYINTKIIEVLNINNSFFTKENFILNDNVIINLNINESIFNDWLFNWTVINEFNLYNTTFGNSIFNNVVFPNELKKWKCTLQWMKDNYRQLKHVMDKNWNHTEANKFFALEMEYYSKLDNISLYEKVSLWFQKLINNYWNNWFKNFLIILLFALLSTLINYFYLLIYYDLIKFNFILTFFNLLSPFYWLWKDTFNTLNLDLPLYWGFILYKIIYWILIYQFIIALKRTTKR
jgi:hypothetical protein